VHRLLKSPLRAEGHVNISVTPANRSEVFFEMGASTAYSMGISSDEMDFPVMLQLLIACASSIDSR